MGEPKDIIERSDRVLDELATLGLGLARDLAARASEAEDSDLAARLAVAFHHVTRSVRQALALQARLQRDRARLAREDRAERIDLRKSQVRAAVGRTLPDEPDLGRALRLDMRLDERLRDEAVLDEAFPDRPVDEIVHRIRKDLGLGLAESSLTSSSGLSRGPMNTASAEGVSTAPPLPEPPTCMDPRDKPEDDGAEWAGSPATSFRPRPAEDGGGGPCPEEGMVEGVAAAAPASRPPPDGGRSPSPAVCAAGEDLAPRRSSA